MKTALLLVLLWCETFAHAQTVVALYESGNAFVRFCSVADKVDKSSSDSDVQHAASCAFYVLGFVHGVEYGTGFTETTKGKNALQPFCRPDGVENGQMVRIVLKFIRENPEEAHKATPLLITLAMAQSYPCPNK